ncbi:MAG: acyltransferase, partial [Candidatus Eremiobacteraeota bacterium]|nr:acyltransferase [Candidatus Eremiobacteraeota bacterium]
MVFYHAGLLECHSGYIGVDVFFVISGYLVSQLILRDLERGQFSLTNFFARRIRRLLPCLLAVCLVTAILGWFFMLPEEFQHLGVVLISQPLLAANFVYAQTTKFGYFGATTVNYPLLHLWSLAVEEQFYVLFPLLLLWLGRCRRGFLFLALFLTSYGLSLWSSPLWPAHAYYLLPTRAFELLAGVLAARLRRAAPGWFNQAASWLALLVILASAWRIPAGTPYPGGVALWPTLAAAVLLSIGARGGSSLHRLLSLRPLAAIGLISYSMYLWHWPVIALLRSSLLWKPHYGTYWLILLFPLSYASWRYIEQPLRRRPLSDRQTFGFAGASGLALAGLGLLIWLNQGFPGRLPERASKLAAQEYTPNPYNLEITLDMISAGQLHHFGAEGKTRLMVIGDSHAMAILPGLDEACKSYGISGLAITRSSTPPLDCDLPGKVGLRGRELRDFCAAFQGKIEQEKPEKVLLVAAWSSYQRAPGFAAGLAETVKACARDGR